MLFSHILVYVKTGILMEVHMKIYLFPADSGHFKSVRHLATDFSTLPTRQEEYVKKDNIKADLAHLLRQQTPQSCFILLYDTVAFPAPKKITSPPCPKSIAFTLCHPKTAEELAEAIRLTDEEKTALRQQVKRSECAGCFEQRQGRITASNFHGVSTRITTLKKNSSADPNPLIRSLMGYMPEPRNVTIKHGRAMEPHAKKAYHHLLVASHRKFKYEDSDLLIHRSHHFICTSPDLLTSCNCGEQKGHPKGICEIKCPELIKDQAPSYQNWSHLLEKDGKSSLSRSSIYLFHTSTRRDGCSLVEIL